MKKGPSKRVTPIPRGPWQNLETHLIAPIKEGDVAYIKRAEAESAIDHQTMHTAALHTRMGSSKNTRVEKTGVESFSTTLIKTYLILRKL